MGLDMYLDKKTYIFSTREGEERDLQIMGEGLEHIKPNRVNEITEEVGYWRKAKQIHRWFVENVQGGEDDCNSYDVSLDQLRSLLGLCNQVLEDHDLAAELLPTESGFFFGGTDYDEYYFKDLEHTKQIIEGILADEPAPEEIPVADETPEMNEVAETLAEAGLEVVKVFDMAKPFPKTFISYEYHSSW